jgi:hypothetical protein
MYLLNLVNLNSLNEFKDLQQLIVFTKSLGVMFEKIKNSFFL